MSYDYKVEPGDTLSAIAGRHGLRVDDLYNHPANGPLRQRHPNKYLVYRDDTIYIPAPDPNLASPTTLSAANQSADRLFDKFSECGKPTKPCPCNLVAKARKKPTTAQEQEIRKHLDMYQTERVKIDEKLRQMILSTTPLADRTRLYAEALVHDAATEAHANDAIKKTIKHYGITDANITSIRYDRSLDLAGAKTLKSGDITVGDDPLNEGPAFLASTIVHEATHANQAELARRTNVGWGSTGSTLDTFEEARAYYSDLKSAKNTGLDRNAADYKWHESELEDYLNRLNAAGLTKFINGNCRP